MNDFSRLDALLRKFVDDGLPGCSCMVARKGEILFEGYYGMADIEKGIPLGPEHVFRQASLTKVALYTTLMMLYEQGRYLMSDPLYEYFPEWRHSKKIVKKDNGETVCVETDKPVTVKNIMNFTCGLPYAMIIGGMSVSHPTAAAMRRAMEPLEKKEHYTLREQIRAMAEVPQAFEPGERHLYGFSSELAAGMLEALCGKSAELVIREMLFEPLGMDSSANFLFGDLEERLVGDYVLKPGKKLGDPDALGLMSEEREKAMVGPLGEVSGFQRVITNCRDYTKLMQMLANGGVYAGERFMGRKTIDLQLSGRLRLRLRRAHPDGQAHGPPQRIPRRLRLDRRLGDLGRVRPGGGGVDRLYAQSDAQYGGIPPSAHARRGLRSARITDRAHGTES